MADEKKLKVSLEEKLVEVGQEPDDRDKRRRKRVELLSRILWQRALDGDATALKHLMDRLPAQPMIRQQPERDPAPKVESFDDVTNVLKALVEAQIIPAEWFQMFAKRSPEDPLQ